MTIKTRAWTRADLERMPDDGNRYEVVRGELFVTPAPSTRHQRLVLVLAGHLRRYVEASKLGEVDQAPSAVVWGGSEVQPDIVVRPVPTSLPETWDEMPMPFLIVEILSTATRRRDLVAKKTLYMDASVPDYWVVDGKDRSIRVIGRGEERVEKESLRWQPAGATEALVLDVKDLFRETFGE